MTRRDTYPEHPKLLQEEVFPAVTQGYYGLYTLSVVLMAGLWNSGKIS